MIGGGGNGGGPKPRRGGGPRWPPRSPARSAGGPGRPSGGWAITAAADAATIVPTKIIVRTRMGLPPGSLNELVKGQTIRLKVAQYVRAWRLKRNATVVFYRQVGFSRIFQATDLVAAEKGAFSWRRRLACTAPQASRPWPPTPPNDCGSVEFPVENSRGGAFIRRWKND